MPTDERHPSTAHLHEMKPAQAKIIFGKVFFYLPMREIAFSSFLQITGSIRLAGRNTEKDLQYVAKAKDSSVGYAELTHSFRGETTLSLYDARLADFLKNGHTWDKDEYAAWRNTPKTEGGKYTHWDKERLAARVTLSQPRYTATGIGETCVEFELGPAHPRSRIIINSDFSKPNHVYSTVTGRWIDHSLRRLVAAGLVFP